MCNKIDRADNLVVSASIAFILISAVLFVYWFRYTCLLILSSRPTRDFARVAARQFDLAFVEVQTSLADGVPDLAALHAKLDKDYAAINRVIHNYKVRVDAVEGIMLRVHFKAMRAVYALTHRLAPKQARAALVQMADTIAHFAGVAGEQALGAA